MLKCVSRVDCRGLVGQPVSLYLGLELLNEESGTYDDPLGGKRPLVHCHLISHHPLSGGGPWYLGSR